MRRPPPTLLLVAGITALAVATAGRTFAQSGDRSQSSDLTTVEPLLPPGISDFDLELFGRLAYTWTEADGGQVVEVLGDFSARLGQYKLSSRDAVVWFKNHPWRDRGYIEAVIFLWHDAQIDQPGGAFESGPALLVTLRTFGKLVLNADSHAAASDADSGLFTEALKAKRLLEVVPTGQAEEVEAPVQVAPTLEQLQFIRPKIRKSVTYSADRTEHQQHGDTSVVISIGNVFVSQGSPSKSGEYLELRADAAVIYLHADQFSGIMPEMIDSQRGQASSQQVKKRDLDRIPSDVPPQDEPKISEDKPDERQALAKWVSAVYLEGNVVLTRGQRMIRASRLYYDFENDRALILDVVTRAIEPKRGLAIYIRAKQVRQLTSTSYAALNAQITTSEFYTPHVAIGAGKVYFEDVTPRNERGEIIGVQAGTYKAKHTTLNIQGTPIAYWPYSAGDFSDDRQAFRNAKIGFNNRLGVTVETEWHLFNLLGMERPEGFDATLKLDYFSDRGPAGGVDLDYTGDNYFGLLRSYYLYDEGEDRLGPTRGGTPDHEDRGRFLLRHRQYLSKGWELTLEAAYLSDDQYLEAFERNEFENGKKQETLLYLLKRKDNWQFSALANWRVNEFQTETEHLPDLRFSLIGEPLGERATLYSDNRAGIVRYRPDERRLFNGQNRIDNTGETGSVFRGDTRQEIQFPLPDLGPIKLTPFLTGRLTGWDGSPNVSGGGGEARAYGAYGIRGNAIFSRVFNEVESALFDLHRLRHIIKADFTAFNAHTNVAPGEITPFDPGVDDIDDFGGLALGLRQRLQTKRGEVGNRRTVDWITLDLEAGFFTDASRSLPVQPSLDPLNHQNRLERFAAAFKNRQHTNRTHGDFISSRPEDSISSSFVSANVQYRLSDSTVIVYDGVFDVNRGELGTSGLSIAVEREPRLAYFAGWRFINDTDNSLFTFGANYKLTEKHTVAFREIYDLNEGRNFSSQFIYIRKWPRWYTAVTLDVDRSLEDVGINLSVWPEGAPNAGFGSKRFTGLTDSVGLQLR